VTVLENIAQATRTAPHRVSVLHEGSRYTYAELSSFIERLGAGLRQCGIRRRERIALLLPNCPEYVGCYLGVTSIGAIAVSLNPALNSEEIAFILDDTNASAVITNPEGARKISSPMRQRLEVIVCGGGDEQGYSLQRWLENDASMAPLALPQESEETAILYTSGTSGFPKGVTLSHGNVSFVTETIARCCNTTAEDRLLLAVPASHCYGQNLVMNHALRAAATLVLVQGFDPERVASAVEREQVTMFFGVPTMYALLLKSRIAPHRMRSLRYCHSGAAPLDEQVAREWQSRYGVPIHQGYGLTECSPLTCYNFFPDRWPASVGRPLAGVQLRIVDDAGAKAGLGEIGEILVHGPNVMMGYWDSAIQSPAPLANGWLRTGDCGLYDEFGNLYIVDRCKDMINVSGLKVYPAEVEKVLKQHPAIQEACVFGVRDELLGETVRAQVVLKEQSAVATKDLSAFCHARIASYKVPVVIDFAKSIPVSRAGKVLRRMLRQEAEMRGASHEQLIA